MLYSVLSCLHFFLQVLYTDCFCEHRHASQFLSKFMVILVHNERNGCCMLRHVRGWKTEKIVTLLCSAIVIQCAFHVM
jgi:hypothetical protein